MPEQYALERWAGKGPPNPAMLRYVLTSEGYEVFSWCDRPGIVYRTHFHDRDQIHWVVSGVLEIVIERVGTFILEAGDRDYMPARTYHSARVIGDEAVHYLVGERR